MPKIINAYADGTSSIADSLSKLGEAIYGDQAKNEVNRQKAFGSKRENDNIPLLADAVARGDRDAIARFGVLSNKTGQDTGDFNRLGVSNHATSVDDPNLALATMGAGGAFTSTAPGQGRQLQNAITTTGMNNDTTLKAQGIQSDRARETQLAIDARTLTPVDDGNGGFVYAPKSEASGRGAPMSSDQVVANVLRKYATPPAVGSASVPYTAADPSLRDYSVTPPAGNMNAPSAPASASPFSNVPPQIQKKAGIYMEPQTMVDPSTGRTGVSHDGGATIVDPTGRTIPVQGTGFMPVGQEAALAQGRDNNVRKSAENPLVVSNPATSQAAEDARKTTGSDAFIQKHANAEVGGLPIVGPAIGAVMKAATGSPEIGPEYERARANQEIRNNQARSVLLGGPGRQTVQAQQWVNELLPQGAAFANPATEAAKIPTIVNALQGDHDQLRQTVLDPNTPPADRAKAAQQMRQIENTIRMFTQPAPAAPATNAAAPAQSTAPQAAAPPTAAPAGAVQMLRQNPNLAADFDAKYGAGASARALGAQ